MRAALAVALLASPAILRAEPTAAAPRRGPSFELEIVPILTRLGCNAGACHGKARGQNGFQLSLLGFNPEFDYAALTSEARGRRVSVASPESSLILSKAAGQVPHGGGRRIEHGGAVYGLLRDWIAQGMPRRQPDDPVLESVSVEPTEAVLGHHQELPLRIWAHYSNGSQRDVTSLAAFQSNESAVAAVDPAGVVKTGPLPGEAAVMSRYMGKIAVTRVLIPRAESVAPEQYAALPRYNFIDELVYAKLALLRILPSGPAPEATWLRRVYLDCIGRLPTAAEARVFLSETSADKRRRLVDMLLERPEYADYWANKWADLLRPNPYRVGIKAVLNFDAWIRDAFRRNLPYDHFVTELLTAQGSTWRNGAATLFRDRREPDELATIVSQLFLGIRLECAKCHHHPFERWGQEDFYGLAAYFARVGRKGAGISPPISGGEEMIFTLEQGLVRHPLTQESVAPKPLFGDAPVMPADADPRESLARWMTSPQNPYFAKVIANRVWAEITGRGLVEPVDDLRATNPPSNEPLLEALAAHLRENKFDLKQLVRVIVSSYIYGLSSLPVPANVTDTRDYSRHYRQRLRAEVLLDAIGDITGVRERFSGVPEQARAMEVWTARTESLFLDAFGRPDPNQDPPCERTAEPTMVQVLHLMNAPGLQAKITADEALPARLAASEKDNRQIVEELYLLCYARFPADDEMQAALELFAANSGRRQVVEDLLWALFNTAEFLFKD
jgi:hypothetical protein